MMVTPCPLCHTVLDSLQREMEKDLNKKLNMPVLHLPQLVGLAIGIPPEKLALERHMIPANLFSDSDPDGPVGQIILGYAESRPRRR